MIHVCHLHREKTGLPTPDTRGYAKNTIKLVLINPFILIGMITVTHWLPRFRVNELGNKLADRKACFNYNTLSDQQRDGQRAGY